MRGLAAIAFVDMDTAGLDPGQHLQVGDDRPRSVAVEVIACGALTAVQTARPWAFSRRLHRHLAAEFVRHGAARRTG
jgi:hypothetical protein